QPFALELLLEAQKALIQRPWAGGPQRLDRELEAAARLVERDQHLCFDLHAFAQLRFQRSGPAAVHDAVDLGAAVLQREVAMPRRRAAEVGELAAHPEERKASLERVADASQQFRNAENGPCEIILHGGRGREPSLHLSTCSGRPPQGGSRPAAEADSFG